MNGADILVIILVAALVAGAAAAMIRNRRKGKDCCGDCSKCSGFFGCGKNDTDGKM